MIFTREHANPHANTTADDGVYLCSIYESLSLPRLTDELQKIVIEKKSKSKNYLILGYFVLHQMDLTSFYTHIKFILLSFAHTISTELSIKIITYTFNIKYSKFTLTQHAKVK